MDRVMRAVKLDPTVYREVSADDTKTTEAMLVVAIAAAIGGLGTLIGSGNFSFGGWILSIALAPTLGLGITTGVLWIIGKLFSGKAQFIEMFRPLGYAYTPSALSIVPFIGGLVGGIWSLVCAVVAVRESEEVTTGSAAAIVLIPAAILFVILMIAAAAIVGSLLGYSTS